MRRQRTNIGKILITGVVVLLLCGIVAAEFPELLTLTDNATNDFTVIGTKSVAPTILLAAKRRVPASDVDSGALAPASFFSHASPFEKEEYVPSGAFVLHPILRT